jgi:phage terminase large subunit-like protein
MDFSEFIDVLDGHVFEEKPVMIEEFVTSEKYLNLPPLSNHQYTMLRASTQIYKKDTLQKLYGDEEGIARWKQTCNEVIFQLGKGSGKDYISTIACAYIVYLLLCLQDPAKYYGKPPGDSIDIINIAINAVQANRVFFKGFVTRIERSPWFQGRYNAKANNVEFDKGVTVHSGHSQRESWEGYNVLVVILDEISGFELESTSGSDQAKTAQAIYKMYKGSVSSRFPDFGKLILLSFPRFKNDYIQQRYNEVVAEKEIVIRTHEFKVDPELPDEIEENKFSIEWEEEHIVSYTVPRVFALKRPTWDVNPTRKIEDFTIDFYSDPVDALGRFACMPPDAVDAFFKSREKIELAFNNPVWAIDEQGRFADWFKPQEDKLYFVHVDLAQKHDHCAVALGHVESWVQMKIADKMTQAAPRVILDAIRWWTPTSTQSVDLSQVKDYILQLKSMGFNLRLVTFDRWNSHDIMQELKVYGVNTEILSVAKKHYEDFAMLVTEERVHGPNNPILTEELLQLRILKGKVDHPRKGSKDLADAVCGAIYNSIAHTPRDVDREIEVYTYSSLVSDREETTKMSVPISAPKRNMPDDIAEALQNMHIL